MIRSHDRARLVLEDLHMASKLTALALGLGLLPVLACDSARDEPGPEGVYEIQVAGGTDAQFPAVSWPEMLTVEVAAILDVEEDRCSGGECWYGNADVKVDGGRPAAAIIRRDGDAADLGLVIDDYPLSLDERSDCTQFAVYAGGFDLRLEAGQADGTGEVSTECIVESADNEVLEDAWADFRWQLSGVRVDGDDP
jgi:hypothetical protein